LTPIVNDEVEEKQKIVQQFARDEKNWMRGLERVKMNADSKAVSASVSNFYYQPQKMNHRPQLILQQMAPFHL